MISAVDVPRAGGAPATPPVQLVAAEYQVKAAFLYNFAKLTTWPEASFTTTNAPLVIAVLGPDPFRTFLDDAVKGKIVEGHPIRVQRFNSPEDVQDCHILFISGAEQEHLADVLAILEKQPVLTVGDMDGFAERGGMIRLLERDENIHFEINPVAVAAAKLKLSPKLLRLATIVRPAPPEGED